MLGKLKPLRTALIPPQSSVPAGITADGKHQLWKRTKPVVKTEPKTDENGHEVWKRNPLNGEPILRVRRVVEVQQTEHLFYLEDHGNGNVQMVDYRFPTEAEKNEADRKAQIAAVQPALAAALVDSGLTVDEVVARLQGQKSAATAPVPAPVPVAELEVEYPVAVEDGMWRLSNGTVIEAEEDEAITAELEVQEAREQAALVPES